MNRLSLLLFFFVLVPNYSAAQSDTVSGSLANQRDPLSKTRSNSLAAEKTLQAIQQLESNDADYSLERHFILLNQYFDLSAQESADKLQAAAEMLKPHFTRLAKESELKYKSVLAFGDKLTTALSGPNGEDIEAALRWKTKTYSEIRPLRITWAEQDEGNPNRAYPLMIKEPKFDGIEKPEELLISFDVTRRGKVLPKSIKVVQSSNERYNEPFVTALKKWKFRPMNVDGKKTAQSDKRILFKIEP